MEFDELWPAINAWVVTQGALVQEDFASLTTPKEDIGGGEKMLIGQALTNAGPPPNPGSSILDFPELLWCEDEWDREREEEARQRIAEQGGSMNEFHRKRFEQKASWFWDQFYKRNTTNAFKDRHYLHIVFPELDVKEEESLPVFPLVLDEQGQPIPSPGQKVLMEVGCGVGNAVLPLLEHNPRLFIFGLDFSEKAIDFLKQHDIYKDSRRCRAYCCDIVQDPLPQTLLNAGEHLPAVAQKLFRALKPGGQVLIRDYGRYDEAQLRFKRGRKISENFYARQDGTRAYYFTIEELHDIFVKEGGFIVLENEYIRRQYANRGQKIARYRSWVHAKFQRPREGGSSS